MPSRWDTAKSQPWKKYSDILVLSNISLSANFFLFHNFRKPHQQIVFDSKTERKRVILQTEIRIRGRFIWGMAQAQTRRRLFYLYWNFHDEFRQSILAFSSSLISVEDRFVVLIDCGRFLCFFSIERYIHNEGGKTRSCRIYSRDMLDGRADLTF